MSSAGGAAAYHRERGAPLAFPGTAVLLTDARVGAHHQHGEVGAVAGEAENGGLQVLVVSSQIDEGDHLGGALTDLLRRPRLAVVDHLKHDQEEEHLTSLACRCLPPVATAVITQEPPKLQ